MLIKQNLKVDYKLELIALLKEYVDCFAWNYTEMLGLSRGLLSIGSLPRMDSGHTNNNPIDLILQSMIELKKKLIGSCA
jgi:hypothetical protein